MPLNTCNDPPGSTRPAGRCEVVASHSADVTRADISTRDAFRPAGAVVLPLWNPPANASRVRELCPNDLPPKIATRITIDPESGCWVAAPPHDKNGYARLGNQGLHRVAYQILVGPIPPQLVLDHVKDRGCTSNACCNPAHLEAVTTRINILRGTSFAAINYAKTRCDNGHEFDLLTTYWRPGGHRDCRICIRARVAKYQRRIRGERAEMRQAELWRAA